MLKINQNYQKLQESYLFSRIAQKVREYEKDHPDQKVIRMGIGDVSLPLCPQVISKMSEAVSEMGNAQTFHGYGPEQGYDFLRNAIAQYYEQQKVFLDSKEIFVSDGAKSDLGNILDLFSKDNTVLIPDPVYPVYVDTNIMDGRKIIFLKAEQKNGFLPLPQSDTEGDIIYLCSPNNPTGAVYNREQLTQWVEFALSHHSLILFDAAYEAFISDDSPRSIYEISGAKQCAVEFCSFSKTAGFTGTRCGYTVVPLELQFDGISLNHLWLRRQTTKFNGVSYVVQKAAMGIFTPEGQKEILQNIEYYKRNARLITDTMDRLNIWYTGGKNSPYIWIACPDQMDSWEFFDKLLHEAQIVGTPGEGFGENGKGYFRFSAFSSYEDTKEAMKRLETLFS
ncbi:MAG: LL-diaminopimelate aminotransferase [Massiliimalia sp.]|jgi:LL-diaminopimelate aminotransferase